MPTPHRVITTPFDASSTADDVVAGIDLAGVRAIVTGASSGIGVETARSLARAGAEVTLAVRNTNAGTKTAKNIADSTGHGNAHVRTLDLIDRASIAEFANRWTGPLHILINNAGVIVSNLARTPTAGNSNLPQIILATSPWLSAYTKPSPQEPANEARPASSRSAPRHT